MVGIYFMIFNQLQPINFLVFKNVLFFNVISNIFLMNKL